MALSAIASKTGCTSVVEREMIRRISAVAVCCSAASVRAWLRRSISRPSSAYDLRPVAAPSTGDPHFRQKFASGGFSCWHRGHFIGYSPRAGRGSGLATIARGLGKGQQEEPGLPSQAISLRSYFTLRLLQPVRHAHVAVHGDGSSEM